MGHGPQPLRPVHALFGQRYSGDDALLELGRLRFSQAGMAAELYADTPAQAEHVLSFVPPHPRLPTLHMNRGLNLLDEGDRAVVAGFGDRFAGRLSGLVVHDQPAMASETGALVAALRDLDTRLRRQPGAPLVFLEYAAGMEPAWFADVAQRLADAERVSSCIDVGHVGIRQARARFGRSHPGLDLQALSTADGRLPELAGEVQKAVDGARSDVLELTRAIARLGKRLHFHLHDGHPLITGLSDHFSFLARLPVPFSYAGRSSLGMLYGPGGLAAIITAAAGACALDALSFTLEIHQVEGRVPLGDAAGLFGHWRDTANAERMNHWLAVLAENALLADESILRALACPAAP